MMKKRYYNRWGNMGDLISLALILNSSIEKRGKFVPADRKGKEPDGAKNDLMQPMKKSPSSDAATTKAILFRGISAADKDGVSSFSLSVVAPDADYPQKRK